MDHETSGAQEWLLPGYGREPPKKPTTTANTTNTTTQAPPPRPRTKPPEQPKKLPSTGPKAPPTGPKNAGAPSRAVPKTGNVFPKVKAYSDKKEAKADVKELGESWLIEHRKEPENAESFPEQFLFDWPKDGPALTECLCGPELPFLDPLRARFGCYMFVSKNLPGYIWAVDHNRDSTKEIAQSLRTLWAEAVAKSNIKAKVYIVEPPAPKAMKGKIVVKKQSPQLHKPALQGSRLKGQELQQWQSRVGLIRSKNDQRLLNAVESCLKGLSFVRGHLRMRVNLGTFLLQNYPKPEGGKSWYGFEEFRGALLHEQTQGRLVPALKVAQPELLERCFEATHLLRPYDGTLRRDAPAPTPLSLRNAELTHSVNFEFLGADRSMLRLEVEFAKTPGAKEYAIKERRWLRPRDSGQSADRRSPLHIAVVDFGRSDWQLEIKSLEFHEALSIDSALKAFAHSVGFRNSENSGNISAKPERKVTFPSEPPVSRFVEKTAIRYQMRGTDYILEVARYDEYRRLEVPIPQTGIMMPGGMSDVPYTTWGASIFDANWDNLLGGHANLPVGHSAKYSPHVATFFPPRATSTSPSVAPKDPSQGLWDLIKLVKQAAELLGPTRVAPEDIDDDTATNTGPTSLKAATKTDVASATEPTAPAAPSPTGMLNADLGTLF
ncbi:uncharacterized protein BDV17DRAFT_295490 [Aspergillus undulatus]|uniref:uncharacterized protein n=1 Tax=Aspergillus undulatus TaxID=1810928 RepID=UPI003CCDC845